MISHHFPLQYTNPFILISFRACTYEKFTWWHVDSEKGKSTKMFTKLRLRETFSKVCLRTVTNQCWRFLDLMWFEPYLYISHITQTPGLISLWYFLVIPLKPSCRFRKCLKSFPENRKTDLTRIIGDTLLHEKLVTKKKKWRKNLGGEGAGK